MTNINIADYIQSEIRREFDQRIFRGIAAEVQSDRMKLIRTGRPIADDRYYAMADVYPIPEQGDEVVGLQVGDGAFILAKVVRPGTPIRHTELTDLNIIGTLTMEAGSSIIGAGGEISLFATDLIVDGGNIDLLSGTLTIDGGDVDLLSGTLTVDGGDIDLVDGDLTLGASGVIRAAGGSYWDQSVLKLVSTSLVGDALVWAYDDGVSVEDIAYVTGDSAGIEIGLAAAAFTNERRITLQDGFITIGANSLGAGTLGEATLQVDVSGWWFDTAGAITPAWNSAVGAIFIGTRTAAPTGNPTNGIYLYVDTSGNLLARTSGGNTRTVAAV